MVETHLQLQGHQDKVPEFLKITFAEALTNSDYMINTTIQLSGYIKVWDSTTPTTSDFHVVTYNTSNNPVNCIFYFSVFAGA